MALKTQPDFKGVVGPVGEAEDLNGDTVPVVVPGTAIVDPTTGNALGTAANPVVVSTGGGGGSDMAVHGPDATGAAPTKDPVFVAGVDTSGDVAPIKTVAGHIQSISEQLQGQAMSAYGTIIVGMDPGGSALPFLVDAEGNLFSSVINRATYWAETTTPLAASATFNGAAREAGPASPGPSAYAYFAGFFLADQTGTASIESSPDNATWTTVATDAVAVSTPLTLQVPITARYYRAVLENGATLQTSLVVNSGFQAG